jgi:hypothetical protein
MVKKAARNYFLSGFFYDYTLQKPFLILENLSYFNKNISLKIIKNLFVFLKKLLYFAQNYKGKQSKQSDISYWKISLCKHKI